MRRIISLILLCALCLLPCTLSACDMGAITEEEYAKKKSELLNGMD